MKLAHVKELCLGVLIGLLLGMSSYFVAESDVEGLSRPAGVVEGNSNQTQIIRCIVVVQPHILQPKKYLTAIRDTYAKKCNETLFFTTSKQLQEEFHEDTKIYLIYTTRTFSHWSILHHALKFSTQHEKMKFNWTIVVNEQSYVVMDNLRNYLNTLNPNVPTIIGKVVEKRSFWSFVFPFRSTEMFELDAGVVLSSNAMKMVADECGPGWFQPRNAANMLRKCASSEGIDVMDPVDEEGLRLFHAQSPLTLLSDAGKPSTFGLSYGKKKEKLHFCSDSAITFGLVNYKDQRMLAYALDSVKIAGYSRVV